MDHIMKRLHYRVGLPGWTLAARFGMGLSLQVQVWHDRDANVFFAKSDDLDGLVVEAPSLEELQQETEGAAEALISFHVNGASRRHDDDLQIKYGLQHSLA